MPQYTKASLLHGAWEGRNLAQNSLIKSSHAQLLPAPSGR